MRRRSLLAAVAAVLGLGAAGALATPGQQIFIGGGAPLNPTWTTISGMGAAVIHASGAGASKSSFRAAGGATASAGATMIADSQVWNGVSWSDDSSMPNTKSNGGGAGIATDMIAWGGVQASGGGTFNNTTYAWNGVSWSTGGGTPGSNQQMSGAGASGTAGISMGGSAGTPLWTYNGTSWATGTSLTTSVGFGAPAGVTTDALVTGGNNGGAATLTQTWNGTSWSTGGALPAGTNDVSGAGPSHAAAVAFGGANSGTTPQKKTYRYDGSSWTTGNDMIAARYWMAPNGGGSNNSAIGTNGFNAGVTGTSETYG